ncbi:MAG: cobalamin biosynthesis protein CobD [Atopobiaceae bacterium]|nr:cobalamin biosynthesis protein CobD [Atopobiaceae bacterium]
MTRVLVLVCACALDALLGDPYSMPHIIRLIGRLIEKAEAGVRRCFPATPKGERVAGAALAAVVLTLSCVACVVVLRVAWASSPLVGFAVETFVCYQMLAARQLGIEARRVYHALQDEGLEAARKAVSMIVGRDTQTLDEAGVTRAAVETVAENASDGFVAPLLFMAVGGPVAGVLYKAANTMDSMVGYKNDAYRYLGTVAAHLDDVFNWAPARITGLLMCLAAPLAKLDRAGAWRIMVRDHARHSSPNAGWPEAACAGALGVMLAGPASYFGKLVKKPTIGDDLRPIEPKDILAANRLLAATATLALVLALALSWAVQSCMGRW